MKVLVYATLTANGHYGIPDPDPTPKEVIADYFEHLKKTGNIIIGRRTYDDLVKYYGGVSSFTSAGADVVILSSQAVDVSGAYLARTPEEALKYLEQKGHATAMVGGGANAINSFLQRKLLDEFYINLLPHISGKGLTLTRGEGKPLVVKLMGTKTLSTDVIQVQYAVSK